jgi:hypothetical protein
MKFYWDQLSPRERDILLRHFLLKKKMDTPVTAEGVCAALQKTHTLSCQSSKEGKFVFQFITMSRSARTGSSLDEDVTEGIFKAALRAKGVEVEDGTALSKIARQSATHERRSTTARAAR